MKNLHPDYPRYFQFDPLIQGWSIDGLYSNEETKKMSEIYYERLKPLTLGENFSETSFYLHYDWQPFQAKTSRNGKRVYFQELKPIENQDKEDEIFLKKALSIISLYDTNLEKVRIFLSFRGGNDFFKSFIGEDDILYKSVGKNADDVKRLLIMEKHLLSRKKELLEWCDNAVLSLFDFHYINFIGNPKDFLSHLQSIADNKLTDSKHDQQLKKLFGDFIESKNPAPMATSTDAKQEKNKLTHAQISLLYIYTEKPITKNNAQEIAQTYSQTSGQKLIDTYKRMLNSLTERTSSKYAARDIEEVIKLLSDPKHLERAKDELKQAKTTKGID